MGASERYLASLLIVVLLGLLLLILREKQIISFKTLRRTLVTAVGLTALPGAGGLPWPFVLILTLAGCAWFYWISWAYEKISEKKQQHL